MTPMKRSISAPYDLSDEKKENIPSDVLDNESSSTSTTSGRREQRKKRQSLLLPSEESKNTEENLEDTGGNEVGYFRQLKNYRSETTATKSSSTPVMKQQKSILESIEVSKESNNNDDLESRAEKERNLLLLRAVRELCSLPQTERFSSNHVDTIAAISGYPLLPNTTERREKQRQKKRKGNGDGTDLDWTSSPCVSKEAAEDPNPMTAMERKRDLIMRMGPIVEAMEKRKEEDTKAVQVATNCRAEKNRRGKFRYYELDTCKQVSPVEFENRYLAMIRDIKTKQAKKYKPLDVGNQMMEDAAVVLEKGHHEDNISVSAGSQLDRDKSGSKRSERLSEDSDSMSIDDESVNESFTLDDSIDVGSGPSAEANQSCEKHHNQSNHTSASGRLKSKVDESGIPCSPTMKEDTRQRPTQSNREISFPSRGTTSSDPAIARAEQRLWSAIDLALEIYSKEIIAIRAARRRIT
mmetsp:Transcript_19864/g.28954  ORF Transcript_19864/g.28954 Transcript_19864/m.28954 type:complete len:467 (-) Transcript_19864:30-1430(-)